MSEKYYGYEIRKPYDGEDKYFRKNLNVAGMAGEDGKVVLNPYSKNTKQQQQVVARNEAIRLWLRDNKVNPSFNITPEQAKQFADTDYGKPENKLHLKHTLIARWLTQDPTAGQMTQMQRKWVEWVNNKLPR